MTDATRQPRTHSFALEVKSRRGEWCDTGNWFDARDVRSAERKARRSSVAWLLERREWRFVDKGRTPRTLFTLTIPLRLP